MSVSSPMFGVARPSGFSRVHSVEEVGLAHVAQDQVLLVRDADFAERELVGKVGDRIHLVGRRVAGRHAGAFQRQRDDRVAATLCGWTLRFTQLPNARLSAIAAL